MLSLLEGIAAGIVISVFNRYLLPLLPTADTCNTPENTEVDDSDSSTTSVVASSVVYHGGGA